MKRNHAVLIEKCRRVSVFGSFWIRVPWVCVWYTVCSGTHWKTRNNKGCTACANKDLMERDAKECDNEVGQWERERSIHTFGKYQSWTSYSSPMWTWLKVILKAADQLLNIALHNLPSWWWGISPTVMQEKTCRILPQGCSSIDFHSTLTCGQLLLSLLQFV